MKKKSLTNEEIVHLAGLAGLSLTKEEIQKYKTQLEETISYIENLNELETKNVNPTSHTTSLTNIYFSDGEKNDRLLDQSVIFQNAKNKEKNYFKVRKILDE